MPKTPKPTLNKKTPKCLVALRHWYSKRSTTQLAIASLVLLAAGFFGFKQAQIYQERSIYRSAEKQITTFVDEAAKLAPSTKEVRKYCSYSSEKFSRGSLGCTVEETLHYDVLSEDRITKTIADLNEKQKSLIWDFAYDNTKNNISTPSIISVKVYKYKELSCGIDYEYKRKDMYGADYDRSILVVSASCSGPALKEYY